MKLQSSTWMLLALAAIPAGCAAPGDPELLESQLRSQEGVIVQLQQQLSSSTEDLRVARAESSLLRDQLTEQGRQVSMLPEQADVLYRVNGIRLHKYLTGGVNKDDAPGDEALTVLLSPHDKDGEVLKLPGGIQIDVFDMSLSADRQKIGSWDYTPEESRQAWHAGYFGKGFMFELPWKDLPVSSTLTVHARLQAADGRDFHTTSQVVVSPPHIVQSTDQPPPLIPAAGTELIDLFENDQNEITTSAAPAETQTSGVETSDRWEESTRPTWR